MDKSAWAQETTAGGGEQMLIQQQPAGPPQSPEILLLTDEMLSGFKSPDRYIKCMAMFGYSMHNYYQDITDDLIDVSYPYILIFLGTMQLGVFHPQDLDQQVHKLVQAIVGSSQNLLIIFCGVVP